MTRCHSVRLRRRCGALGDEVAVGEVDMGLVSQPRGCTRPSECQTFLEVELQSQLDDARLVHTRDLAECRAVYVRIDSLEVRMIENVERLNPELEVRPFG